jgi:RNA polymerase-binding protein DksA
MAISKRKSAKTAKLSKAKPAARKLASRPAAKAARRPAVKPVARKPAAKPAPKRAVKTGAKSAAKSAAKRPTARTTVKAAGKPPAKAGKTARKPAAKAGKAAGKAPAKAAKRTPAAKKAAAKAVRPPKGKAAAKPAAKAPAKALAKAAPRASARPAQAQELRPAPRPSAGLDHIDRKTLTQIIAKLEEMRDESQAIVNQNMQSDLKPREESSDVGDDLDQASNERDREFNLIMHQRHLRRLQQIQEAFERIEEGSYGLCEGTDEPINPKRLLIMPLARYSLEYQEQQEKMMGRGAGGEGFYESGEESFSSDDL